MPLFSQSIYSLQPIYQHGCPKSIVETFPPNERKIILSEKDGCVCDFCMPRLWKLLAPHTVLPTTLGGNYISPINARTSLEKLLHEFSVNIMRLTDGHYLMPSERFIIVYRIPEIFKKLERSIAYNPQDIKAHCESLDEMFEVFNNFFFGGRLTQNGYTLVDDNVAPGYTRPDGIVCMQKSLFTKFSKHDNAGPGDSVYALATTLLHEQVHSYMFTNTCRGHCKGSDEQKDLCDYLYARMVDEFCAVKYKDTILVAEATYGHGVTWQITTRQQQDYFDKGLVRRLGWDKFKLWAAPCKCGFQWGQGCWSHCKPGLNSFLYVDRLNLKRQIKEVDQIIEDVIKAAKEEENSGNWAKKLIRSIWN